MHMIFQPEDVASWEEFLTFGNIHGCHLHAMVARNLAT